VSDRVVIDTVVSKYADHCRCTGRSAILERDSGAGTEPPDAGWLVMRVGEFLCLSRGAAAGATPRKLPASDETPVGVRCTMGMAATIWLICANTGGRMGRWVRLPHGAWTRRPETFLGNFDGSFAKRWICRLRFRGRAEMVHACCWSHAKRKFVEACEVASSRWRGGSHVRLIDELFAIDAEARARIWTTQRATSCAAKAPPLLEKIKAAVTTARATSIARQRSAKAANYNAGALAETHALPGIPGIELSNNLAENSMRPVALRVAKTGSTSAASKPDPKSPHPLCRRNLPTMNIPVREYLAAVLPGLAETPIHRLPQLTPDRLGFTKPLTSTLVVNHGFALTHTVDLSNLAR